MANFLFFFGAKFFSEKKGGKSEKTAGTHVSASKRLTVKEISRQKPSLSSSANPRRCIWGIQAVSGGRFNPPF
jgi:hypothetical protein